MNKWSARGSVIDKVYHNHSKETRERSIIALLAKTQESLLQAILWHETIVFAYSSSDCDSRGLGCCLSFGEALYP